LPAAASSQGARPEDTALLFAHERPDDAFKAANQ
jgi:hypothetical protein